MFPTITENQRTISVSNAEYLPILVESFLVDRRTQGLARGTIEFYRTKLIVFQNFAESHALTQLTELTPDFLRQFILYIGETHNPGGIHTFFRSLRAFLLWVEFEEVAPEGWKNPIHKIKSPKVPLEPIEPVSLEDVSLLLSTCQRGIFIGERDRAIILTLLDTGARARELCNINLEDLDLASGSVMIKQGKGRKPRVVFYGRKTRRAIRAYLRQRKDDHPALFVTHSGERMAYETLRDIMRRRAKLVGIDVPTLHDFRRAFALEMLRNGADIFALQKLMGHADLQVLRRYLAQTDTDLQRAHDKGGPVDNMG
jgi:integrase/recombinase XerC